MRPAARAVAAVQGAYYLVTGVWPMVSLGTFELVTGPKTDDWLVRTVGALTIAIALALLAGARRREPAAETLVLAGAAAAAFAAVDIVYVLVGRIRPIYLADAAVEAAFLLALLAARPGRGRGR
ncbi:MAG TPA: hypothetical protein VFS05_05590 [Gemmatimonadaceae bacterium]|nr:hypothetical protein [Gemmatimonadaceae bacterium]